MANKKYAPVRIYKEAHGALVALTEQAKLEWGLKSLSMTEYLSKLIIEKADAKELPYTGNGRDEPRRRKTDGVKPS